MAFVLYSVGSYDAHIVFIYNLCRQFTIQVVQGNYTHTSRDVLEVVHGSSQ